MLHQPSLHKLFGALDFQSITTSENHILIKMRYFQFFSILLPLTPFFHHSWKHIPFRFRLNRVFSTFIFIICLFYYFFRRLHVGFNHETDKTFLLLFWISFSFLGNIQWRNWNMRKNNIHEKNKMKTELKVNWIHNNYLLFHHCLWFWFCGGFISVHVINIESDNVKDNQMLTAHFHLFHTMSNKT